MSTRRLVHSETCKAGELVKIAKEFENHWACKKFVGKLGKLRVKDDFAGKESALISLWPGITKCVSGWWVEFEENKKIGTLFQVGDKGVFQLEYASEVFVCTDFTLFLLINLPSRCPSGGHKIGFSN